MSQEHHIHLTKEKYKEYLRNPGILSWPLIVFVSGIFLAVALFVDMTVIFVLSGLSIIIFLHPRVPIPLALIIMLIGVLLLHQDLTLSFGLLYMCSACLFMRYLFERVIRNLCAENDYIKTIAMIDPLTEVYNRRFLLAEGEKAYYRFLRQDVSTSIILLDIDHFKIINDSFGHATGDRVLRKLTGLLRQNLRAQDILGRYGGDEFLIILPDTAIKAAHETAERIHEIVSKGHILETGISMGVAEINRCNNGFSELIEHADKALYQAKQAGRNRIKLNDYLSTRETMMNVQEVELNHG